MIGCQRHAEVVRHYNQQITVLGCPKCNIDGQQPVAKPIRKQDLGTPGGQASIQGMQ
jgi:hypothetical protein